MATEVLSKLKAVLEGARTAFPATQHHMVVLADCLVFTAQAVSFHMPIEPLGIVEGALTVFPQTQEVVRDVRDEVAALEVQDAGAEVSLALQGLQPALFQLGVVAVEVDMAHKISRTVQRTKAALLPQAGEFFLCKKGFRRKSLILSRALRPLSSKGGCQTDLVCQEFTQQILVFNDH